MIDIHSHIIFGVDDGAPNINESIRMLAEAEKLGIKAIVATPHYHEDVFNGCRVRERYEELVEKASDYNVAILLGYEAYLNPKTAQKIFSNSLNINESRFVLIELPFDLIPPNINETIYQLQLNGIKPILAHPERNKNLNKSPRKLGELVEMGCLVQLDAASTLGVYGRTAKAFAKHVLRAHMVDFVASDAHCARDYRDWYEKAYKKVSKWAGKEYSDRIFNSNALDVIRNDTESETILYAN